MRIAGSAPNLGVSGAWMLQVHEAEENFVRRAQGSGYCYQSAHVRKNTKLDISSRMGTASLEYDLLSLKPSFWAEL